MDSAHGFQAGQRLPITVWQQIYENGRVLCDVTRGRIYVFYGGPDQPQFDQVKNPESIITYGAGHEHVNQRLVDTLITQGPDSSNAATYRDLVQAHRLRGGIGTVYLERGLYSRLGEPQGDEELFVGLAVIGSNAELLVSARNRSGMDSKASFLLDSVNHVFERYEHHDSQAG